MNLVLGIDPGIRGALAWLDCRTGCVTIEDIPRNKGGMDGYALAARIDAMQPMTRVAWIEAVTVWRSDGPKGAATFSRTYGEIRGIVIANMIPLAVVAPMQWRAHFGLSRKGKDGSVAKATELWGDSWGRRVDRAEAALIAKYGMDHTG